MDNNIELTTPQDKHPFKETIGKLLNYCKPYWPAIIISIIASIIGTILTIVGPDKLSEMTNLIIAGIATDIDLAAISKIGIVLAIMYGFSFVLTLLQGLIMSTVTQRITKNLRTDISRKINVLPLNYFDTNNHGDILSRVSNDVDTVAQTLSQSVSSFISAAVMFVGSLFMMFSTNWILSVSAILSSMIGFVLLIIIGSRSQKYFAQQQEYLGKINGHVEEVYAGHSVIKAYNAKKDFTAEYDQINDELYDSTWKAQFMSGLMMPIMMFIGNFSYVVVCVVGAILAMNGSISFGVIVAFMVYIRLFTQPLSEIASAASSLQQASAASYRVFEILGEEELNDESHKERQLETVKGDITFDHVKFGYDPEKIIIKDFSIDIKAGQKVAIVGPTGAGKTTLVNLLMRFYEVNEGEILIDSVPINNMKREEVLEMFCMVLQDTWLFKGTIKENIVYNQKGITDEQVKQAAKAAGIDHFVSTLPDGYETVLDEKASLAEGQKQLITIARAMIQNAPMLILDEATSSVDTRTEVLIQEAMDKLMVGRTSIVIAHRLSTIKNSDLILVLKDGDIVETGNHEQLVAQNGFYSELYNSQFEE